MLQWMRNAQTWVIKGVLLAVVLAFVVTIFYQWGVRSGGGPTRSEVATIFGQPVSIREFQNISNALQQRYRDIFRMQAEVDLNEQFNFREMALEELARRAILLRLAQQYGVVVTQPELEDSHRRDSAFPGSGSLQSGPLSGLLAESSTPDCAAPVRGATAAGACTSEGHYSADGRDTGDGRRSRTDVSSRL